LFLSFFLFILLCFHGKYPCKTSTGIQN
jgi:hypothetical protein